VRGNAGGETPRRQSEMRKSSFSFHSFLVRVRRIELRSRPWQGRVLPLNHARKRVDYTEHRASGNFAKKLRKRCSCCSRQDSNLTGSVHLCGFLAAEPLKNIAKVFESRARAKKFARSVAHSLYSCAPARIRTWNDSSEDCCDIRFTTGA
jgi:hypothetical protein